jgi:predicted RNase H-like nuclease (RuvC/YqgF family)
MLKFKKITRGTYISKTERYTIRIEKQDISKVWVLSIQDNHNRDCLTDTTYATYKKKSYCIEDATLAINQ